MNRIPIKFQIEPEAEEAIRLCLLFKRSVAVEKDSDDPYLDFRHSMLQMILEKQIYSKDDLGQLLDLFPATEFMGLLSKLSPRWLLVTWLMKWFPLFCT
ncbi:hypothetical protein OIU76_023506 [Salix suchowensis]|nr:hypothetical protein OIU76_023506 [Salix suchowensis]